MNSNAGAVSKKKRETKGSSLKGYTSSETDEEWKPPLLAQPVQIDFNKIIDVKNQSKPPVADQVAAEDDSDSSDCNSEGTYSNIESITSSVSEGKEIPPAKIWVNLTKNREVHKMVRNLIGLFSDSATPKKGRQAIQRESLEIFSNVFNEMGDLLFAQTKLYLDSKPKKTMVDACCQTIMTGPIFSKSLYSGDSKVEINDPKNVDIKMQEFEEKELVELCKKIDILNSGKCSISMESNTNGHA